ncbi:hypothetical protein E3N88_13206 [Mikania micrantha]|uniref:Uncharacterized protein n=1 Tax=Mikania micrantha TaxID=192012 RepID=A0A5N6PA87_9ASTR|nr:hypothetical protein E3N88_13206 [Mikania micrantha]
MIGVSETPPVTGSSTITNSRWKSDSTCFEVQIHFFSVFVNDLVELKSQRFPFLNKVLQKKAHTMELVAEAAKMKKGNQELRKGKLCLPFKVFQELNYWTYTSEIFPTVGRLPSAFGGMFPHLVSLLLWGNQLTGPLPSSISNCTRLTNLQMNKNSFSGKLTIDFSKLKDIYFITIGYSNFGSKEADEMKFVDSLKNCTALQILDLSYCNFVGVLPGSIGNLSSQLSYLSLEENQMEAFQFQ